ncbi:hypothetical protein M073_2408 [Bacteroides fragilis str. DS-71]|nr:hypothetical protein M073_2408 [Bacteroides fragilis str. DS-71]
MDSKSLGLLSKSWFILFIYFYFYLLLSYVNIGLVQMRVISSVPPESA